MGRLRLSLRQGMGLVLAAALLLWGGVLAWRHQHFRRLAERELAVAREAAAGEIMFRQKAELAWQRLRAKEQQVAQLGAEDLSQLTEDERSLKAIELGFAEAQLEQFRRMADRERQTAEKFADLRRRRDAQAGRSWARSVRPWAGVPQAGGPAPQAQAGR